ncbi:MAG: hypothetical protein J6B41_04540 [Alistipes sp.]|nr:hypothetical protein [Alistipes sp.]
MKALKIIFAIVASLIGLELLCGLLSIFPILSFEGLNIAIFILDLLLYSLIAIGFFIWFAKSKPGMKVKGGAMVLAISASLSVVLDILQFFGLTRYEFYDWDLFLGHTVYRSVELGFFGWLAISIVNLIGVILLMRSIRGRGFLKTSAIIYPSLFIIFESYICLMAISEIYSLYLWDFEAYICFYALVVIAQIFGILFYALYASTFKAQPALVQGPEPIQSAEPVVPAAPIASAEPVISTEPVTPATPAALTPEQQLERMQQQIEELRRELASQQSTQE